MPENSLFYINQSYISTVKNGDLGIYHHNFIIGHNFIIVAANQPPKIDQYVCKDNEVKLFTCIYILQMGEFLGFRCDVVFIVLRGDERELFCLTDSILKKIQYSIYLRNKKYLTPSLALTLKNNTVRL